MERPQRGVPVVPRHECHAASGGVVSGLRWMLLAPCIEVFSAPQRGASDLGGLGEVGVSVDEVVQRLTVDAEVFSGLFRGEVACDVHGSKITGKVSSTTATVGVVKLLDRALMNLSEQAACSGLADELPCPRPAATTSPFPVCQQHRVEIAMSVIPEILGRELAALLAIPTTPLPRPDAVTVESLWAGPHEEVVYFIANGGRVKIGFTTNLRSRLSALSLRRDNVLTALEGGTDLEQILHAHFSEHRRGNTEWFDLAPEIVRYISEVSKNPRPAALRQADEVEVEPVEPTPQIEALNHNDLLRRALKVVDELGADRVSRAHLATHLTGGDESLLRIQMREAGCNPVHSLKINGRPARGWYKSEIEEALTFVSA